MKIFKMALSVLTMLLVGNCAAMAAEMTISAAASLTNAFGEMKELFEKSHPGLTVHTNFAASNPLLRQLAAGAPADVFASADQQTMDQALDAGVVDAKTRRNFAANDLVLVVPKNASRPQSLSELEKFGRIAIGNPDSVPAGRYARQTLANAGIFDRLGPQFILGESVRQVLDYVARGEVDAGFVYRTDAAQRKDKVDIAMIVDGHEPITYPIAVALTGNNPQAGQEFLEYALSPAGQAVLAKYGFSKP